MGQSFKAKLSIKMKSLFSILLISSYITLVFGNKYQELLEVQKSSSKVGSSREDYNGLGTVQCYGYMSVAISKWDSGTGSAACRPRFSGSAPQGYVADCEGEVTYTTGDIGLGYCTYQNAMSTRKFSPKLLTTSLNPRLFCGYFTCTGVMELVCDGMLSGCHG